MLPITIVVLDIHEEDHAYDFADISIEERIERFVKQIESSYQQVKELHSENAVIITWREYGLFNRLTNDGRAIDFKMKNFFKEEMCRITHKYSDLYIIAGTIAAYKEASDIKNKEEKLKQLKSRYTKNTFIKEIERNYVETVTKKMTNADEIARTLDENLTFIKEEKRVNCAEPFFYNTITNRCRIFAHGQKIDDRDKMMPYHEYRTHHENNFIYKFKENFSIHEINIQGINVTFIIEICREHGLAFAKKMLEKLQLSNPMLQFILSDSVSVIPENFCANTIVQADSSDGVNVYQNDTSKQSLSVYKLDFFVDDAKLEAVIAKNPRKHKLEFKKSYVSIDTLAIQKKLHQEIRAQSTDYVNEAKHIKHANENLQHSIERSDPVATFSSFPSLLVSSFKTTVEMMSAYLPLPKFPKRFW